MCLRCLGKRLDVVGHVSLLRWVVLYLVQPYQRMFVYQGFLSIVQGSIISIGFYWAGPQNDSPFWTREVGYVLFFVLFLIFPVFLLQRFSRSWLSEGDS